MPVVYLNWMEFFVLRSTFLCLATALVAGWLTGCVSHADQRCVSDDECRSDRICGESGWCIDPSTNEPDAGDTVDADADVEQDTDTAPPAPDLVAQPNEVVFPLPDPTARQRIEWKLIYLRNRGDATLELGSVAVIDSESFELRYPQSDPVEDVDNPSLEPTRPPESIAAGDRIPVRVWYSTDDAREDAAIIEIRSNDPDEPVKQVPLIANPSPPCLEFPRGDRVVFDLDEQVREKTVFMSNCSDSNALIIDDFRLEQDGGGALKLDETTLPTFPAEIAPGEGLVAQIQLTSTRDDWNRGVIVVESNDPYRPRATVDILRDTAGNDCPVASVDAFRVGDTRPISNLRQLEPGTTVELDGSGSADPDGEIVEYQWSLLEKPGDSGATFLPSPRSIRPTLFLDAPGTYLAELVVVDDEGTQDCAAPGQILMVATRNDIRVELDWRTPGDPDPNDSVGSNVDLHYLHPNGRWNEAPWDIWEEHPTDDWSRIQRPDTPPEMQAITRNGPGREVIYHATPEFDLEFSVGVFYVDDRGFGPSFATVRLITDGQVVWESREVRLVRSGDFYKAAHFAMPGPQIIEIDEKSEGFPLR
ncbi:MAG: PKD domain-containing protein [Myxococcota bacterium]